MVGRTNVAGERLRSIIAVTYPEGSICTCSDGTKTLKAKDTSGKSLFNVTVGTWAVSCTDGRSTASKKVSVTAEGHGESVTLSYELMLYDSGNQYTGVTGGWKFTYNDHGGQGTGTVTFGASSVTITPAAYTSTSIATVNKINLANVKTLNVTLDRYDDNIASLVVHASKQNPDLNPDAGEYTEYKAIPSNGVAETSKYSGTVSLDVSSLTESYYIVIGSRGDDAGRGKLVVYKVWGDPN